MIDFRPSKWFWVVDGDQGRAWSSAVGGYVDDWPADQVTRIASEEVLTDALRRFGLPGPAPTDIDVRAEAGRRLRGLATTYSAEERETWATQVKEANAVTADPAADTPLLTPLAAARGITVAEMAVRVLGLNSAFSQASGAILAVQEGMIANGIPIDYTHDRHWS